MKISTQFQYFGWVATLSNYDGPGSPIGMGSTEQGAIDNLLEVLYPDEPQPRRKS